MVAFGITVIVAMLAASIVGLDRAITASLLLAIGCTVSVFVFTDSDAAAYLAMGAVGSWVALASCSFTT